MKTFVLLAVGVLAILPTTGLAGWLDSVSVQQQARQQIRSTDILYRPYRRGHFYGNAVRRRHHEGTSFRYGR